MCVFTATEARISVRTQKINDTVYKNKSSILLDHMSPDYRQLEFKHITSVINNECAIFHVKIHSMQ